MAYCDKYAELISAAIDGALSPAEESRLAAHLAQCPDCKALYDELAVLHAALTDLPPVELPAGLTERVMAAVAGSQVIPFEKKKAPRPWQRWLASAAVLAVVLAGTWSWRPWEKTSGDLSDSESFPQAAESVATEAGGAADVMPEEVPAPKENTEMAVVSNGYDRGSEDTDAIDPRSVSYSGTKASEKVAIGGLQKDLNTAATADSFDEAVPAEPEEEGAVVVSPMTRTVTGGSGGDGISAFALPTEAPAAASYNAELFMAYDEAGVEEALEMTPRQALERLLEEYPRPGCETWEYGDIEPGWQSPEWITADGSTGWLAYYGPIEDEGHIYSYNFDACFLSPEGELICPATFIVPTDGGEIQIAGA